jgi:hypothetical protein
MIQHLYTTPNLAEADLLVSALRAAGLHPLEVRTWPHITLAGAEIAYTVEVPSEENELARFVMKDLVRDPEAM